jgi:hypothetical protein
VQEVELEDVALDQLQAELLELAVLVLEELVLL